MKKEGEEKGREHRDLRGSVLRKQTGRKEEGLKGGARMAVSCLLEVSRRIRRGGGGGVEILIIKKEKGRLTEKKKKREWNRPV